MPYLKTLDQRHGIRISGAAVTVGSEADNHIPIRPPFVVAPKQFTLIESGGRYLIQNTDAAGRTHVNGQPVTEVWLRDGDVIHAGELALLYIEDKEGEEDPALKQQRPSTPFQTEVQMLSRKEKAAAQDSVPDCPPTLLLDPPPAEENAPQEPEPTNYDDVAVSTLAADAATATLGGGAPGTAGLRSATTNSSAKRERTLAPTWLVIILVTLGYAWWQNGSYLQNIFPQLSSAPADEKSELIRQPNPLTAELDEHLKAVQLVATLPPETFSSLALSEFLAKTSSPWVKDRVEKQLVRALLPVVRNADQVERITLLDAAQPASRMLVVTLKGRPALKDLLKDVAETNAQPITISGLNASRLSSGNSEVRHIVEVSPGTFVISDIPLERLTMRFDLAARVGRPTGVVAMARAWPGGFLASVNPVKLYDYGLEKDSSGLTKAPIISVDFEPLPQASVILPTLGEAADRLTTDWKQRTDDVATRLASLGIVSHSGVCASQSTVQLHGEMQAATLLDEIWRKHFADLDLKFRPLPIGLAAN